MGTMWQPNLGMAACLYGMFAPRCPVRPLNFTARTTQRCIRSKALNAEKAVAAVKAWAEQHEVCFLTLAENNFCQANIDQMYASGRSHTLVRNVPSWNGSGDVSSSSCCEQERFVIC